MKNQTDTLHSADIYREEYAFLAKARQVLADPALSPDALQESYRALLAEHDSLLGKIVKMTGIGDKAQRKLLNANTRIKEQQEELAEKNARLEQEIIERTALEAQLQRRNPIVVIEPTRTPVQFLVGHGTGLTHHVNGNPAGITGVFRIDLAA